MGLMSCRPHGSRTSRAVDSLCMQAYRMRYTDIDSTEADLRRALKQAKAERFSEEKARALVLMGFVRYQKMDFEDALALADSTVSMSNNQVTLLCADILKMKVFQRISDAGRYYQTNSSAVRRLSLIENEKETLDGIDKQLYQYAQTEYHYIASTYYYYQQEDSLSKNEMQIVERQLEHLSDTTQLVYYYYMMGSGGLVDGDDETVLVKEFDYLLTAYSISKRSGILYFEANSLQALAVRLKSYSDRSIIRQRFPGAYQLLVSQHLSWNDCIYDDVSSDGGIEQDDVKAEQDDEQWLPTAIARHALHTFKVYDDLFQTACCYRTLGELESQLGHYDASLDAFSQALSCVNKHHRTYYPCHDDTLSLYPTDHYLLHDVADSSAVSNERRWIENPNILTVPEWMAGIRQQISVVFSCLGDRVGSNYNRNIYLDILECTSQNLEMESRLDELKHQFRVQNRLMWTAMSLFLLVLLMCGFIFFRQELHDIAHLQLLGKQKGRILRNDKHRLDELNDELEDISEKCNVSRIQIDRNKSQGLEKRAKVSLVQAVTPFLDRILNEVNRMNRQPRPQLSQLNYVGELTDQIMEYNDILTEWIKIEQGQLSLHISTIEIESLFDILRKGHFSYDQQGIVLDVHHTTAKVKADEALTLFMLNTLADNARKFTPKGGTVTVEAIETEQYVELSVTDTGCGMSQDDVDTILQNKVYDAKRIGIGSASNTSDNDDQQFTSKKGHGFGLMNCKGIIEKYRKTSDIFSVCMFGIESTVGKGSRFFFRLPRVLILALAVLFSSLTYAQEANCAKGDSLDAVYPEYFYYDQCFEANNQGDAERALAYADSALMCLNDLFVLYDDNTANASLSPDLQSFLRGDSLDYSLLVNLRNQIAVAALVLGDHELYNYNNSICTQLYRVIHQDTTLPTYYDRIKKADANIRQITVALVLLSLLVIVLIVMLIRSRKQLADRLTTDLRDKIEKQQDVLNHLQFEENRLYVQNQVLDNCLSTIKHESMYFPSRINVLVQRMIAANDDAEHSAVENKDCQEDLVQLTELTAYYKQLYTLLSGQAERQAQQNVLHLQKVQVEELLNSIKRTFKDVARKSRFEGTFVVECADENSSSNNVVVRADGYALDFLFRKLFDYIIHYYPTAEHVRLTYNKEESTIRFTLYVDGMNLTEEEAHNLFYPSASRIQLLVVKQIIREIDALNNNPGLRLVAQYDCLWFTVASTTMQQ